MAKFSFTKRLKITIFFDQAKIFEDEFEDGPIVFGREPACDVVLDYPFVSRLHCQITEDSAQLCLQNLKSRNGIYWNGSKIERHEFSQDFEFRLDKLLIQVVIQPLSDRPTRVQATREAKAFQAAQQAAGKAAGKSPSSSSRAQNRSSGEKLSSRRKGLIDKNFSPEMLELHPGLSSAKSKRLEAIVTWNDQIIDVKEFEPRDKVTIGPSPMAEISIPVLKRNWSLAHVEMEESSCQIIKDLDFELTRKGQTWKSQDLLAAKAIQGVGSKVRIKITSADILRIFAGAGVEIVLRYIPATQGVRLKKLNEPDAALKHALIGSAILHGVLSLLLIVTAPQAKNVPQLKNVPERFARLLVEPPKPILPAPTPPPPIVQEPEPEPVKKELVKKPEPPPRKQIVKQERPKPILIKQPKQLAKVNKYPLVVKNPVAKASPPVVNFPKTDSRPSVKAPAVKVESLGALAALGGAPLKSEVAAPNINIKKNSPGGSGKAVSLSGVVGSLPSSSGKLFAGGGDRVKTKGQGAGGSEYGTQGLKGSAGSRGVGAGVVGQPKLAQSGKLEGLTRQQVMDVVQMHLPEIQHCYEKALLSDSSLAGRMEFEWDIDAGGKVFAVKVKRSTINGGDSLGECVKAVFSAMRFPRATNGQSTTPSIGFPFGRM